MVIACCVDGGVVGPVKLPLRVAVYSTLLCFSVVRWDSACRLWNTVTTARVSRSALLVRSDGAGSLPRRVDAAVRRG